MLAGQPPFTGPTARRFSRDMRSIRCRRSGRIPPRSGPGWQVQSRRRWRKSRRIGFSAREFGDALAVSKMSTAPTALAPARTPPRPLALVAAAVTLVAVLVIVVAARGRSRTGTPVNLDPAVVAIAPFRIATADSSLGYLSEGLVDLLATKFTSEVGLRAADPRSVLIVAPNAGCGKARKFRRMLRCSSRVLSARGA